MTIDTKNILLIFTTLTVLGIIGILIPYERSANIREQPPQTFDGAPDVIVEYRDTGFSPPIITIQKDKTIGWVNHSKNLMWVASDPHPSHKKLRGFDSRQGLHSNDTNSFFVKIYAHEQNIYTYTFTTLGKWTYHNHLNPTHQGTVEVIE